jgi:mono/diheme cytochrome c family protein
LAAALLVFPVLALSYVLIAPNGPGCGSSGQLAIDAETGLAENCDGSEYGVDEVSFFTIGQEVYTGSGRCAGCHGDDGGGGTGPAMSGGAVLVTFPGDSCADHIAWIELGSDGWPEATYGANGTPVGSSGAQMPGFADSLTPEELAAVVIYERVAFGGQSLADAEADCGTEELEVAAGG